MHRTEMLPSTPSSSLPISHRHQQPQQQNHHLQQRHQRHQQQQDEFLILNDSPASTCQTTTIDNGSNNNNTTTSIIDCNDCFFWDPIVQSFLGFGDIIFCSDCDTDHNIDNYTNFNKFNVSTNDTNHREQQQRCVDALGQSTHSSSSGGSCRFSSQENNNDSNIRRRSLHHDDVLPTLIIRKSTTRRTNNYNNNDRHCDQLLSGANEVYPSRSLVRCSDDSISTRNSSVETVSLCSSSTSPKLSSDNCEKNDDASTCSTSIGSGRMMRNNESLHDDLSKANHNYSCKDPTITSPTSTIINVVPFVSMMKNQSNKNNSLQKQRNATKSKIQLLSSPSEWDYHNNVDEINKEERKSYIDRNMTNTTTGTTTASTNNCVLDYSDLYITDDDEDINLSFDDEIIYDEKDRNRIYTSNSYFDRNDDEDVPNSNFDTYSILSSSFSSSTSSTSSSSLLNGTLSTCRQAEQRQQSKHVDSLDRLSMMADNDDSDFGNDPAISNVGEDILFNDQFVALADCNEACCHRNTSNAFITTNYPHDNVRITVQDLSENVVSKNIASYADISSSSLEGTNNTKKKQVLLMPLQDTKEAMKYDDEDDDGSSTEYHCFSKDGSECRSTTNSVRSKNNFDESNNNSSNNDMHVDETDELDDNCSGIHEYSNGEMLSVSSPKQTNYDNDDFSSSYQCFSDDGSLNSDNGSVGQENSNHLNQHSINLNPFDGKNITNIDDDKDDDEYVDFRQHITNPRFHYDSCRCDSNWNNMRYCTSSKSSSSLSYPPPVPASSMVDACCSDFRRILTISDLNQYSKLIFDDGYVDSSLIR